MPSKKNKLKQQQRNQSANQSPEDSIVSQDFSSNQGKSRKDRDDYRSRY